MDQEKEKDMGTIKQKMSKQRVVEKFTELHKKYFVNSANDCYLFQSK